MLDKPLITDLKAKRIKAIVTVGINLKVDIT
jgi:hypothetical protein